MKRHKTAYFLYAEDDPDDRDALREIVEGMSPALDLQTCDQGLALMQYLQALEPGEPLPCCIVLDMNMPLWDGLHTLSELKKQEEFKHLPVVMFSTSNAPRDFQRSMEMGAEAFLTKPVGRDQIQHVTDRFAAFGAYPVTLR